MRIAVAILSLIVSCIFLGDHWGARRERAKLSPGLEVSPGVALRLMESSGWSNIALHADQGTNCLWLGMTNLSMLPVRFFTNEVNATYGTNAGAGGKQPKLTGKANDEI